MEWWYSSGFSYPVKFLPWKTLCHFSRHMESLGIMLGLQAKPIGEQRARPYLLKLLFLSNKWFVSGTSGMEGWYGSSFSNVTQPSSCLGKSDITSLCIWHPSAWV